MTRPREGDIIQWELKDGLPVPYLLRSMDVRIRADLQEGDIFTITRDGTSENHTMTLIINSDKPRKRYAFRDENYPEHTLQVLKHRTVRYTFELKRLRSNVA